MSEKEYGDEGLCSRCHIQMDSEDWLDGDICSQCGYERIAELERALVIAKGALATIGKIDQPNWEPAPMEQDGMTLIARNTLAAIDAVLGKK